jgi:hypothetical protein
MHICLRFPFICWDTHLIPNLCSGFVMESYYSAQEACHLSKCMTCPYLDWDFYAHSNEYCMSLKCVTLSVWMKQTVALWATQNWSLNSVSCPVAVTYWKFVDTGFYSFTVGMQQVNASLTAWSKIQCVNGGVCRGKVISELHFKSYFRRKKRPPGVASLYLEIAWDHFLITKVADIINFVNESVIVLEGSLQWNKRC